MDPLTIAALFSILVGTASQAYSAHQVDKRRQQVQQAEQVRQAGFDDERVAAVNAAKQKFTPQQQQLDQQSIAGKLAQQLTPSTLAPSTGQYLPSNPGAPQAVSDSLTNRLTDALARGRDYAKNMAAVNSVGRLNFGNATTLNRLGETTGQLNQNAANSANITGLEFGAAPNAGRTAAGIGDIANGLGNILFLQGITKNKLPVRQQTPSPIVDAFPT